MKLLSCVRCAGFVNPLSSTCPHCSARVEGIVPLLGRVALAVVGGSALSMTMMACYGSPPCDTTNDADGDGVGTESVEDLGCYAPALDCDDTDATSYPNAIDDTVDGIDQNCDERDGPYCFDDTACPADAPSCNVTTNACGAAPAEGEGEGEGEG